PLARARPKPPRPPLDRRLEPRLVGRLPGAPVLPAGLRPRWRRDPPAEPRAAPGRGRLPDPLHPRPAVAGRRDVPAAQAPPRRRMARPAGGVPRADSPRGPARRRRGEPPVGHRHEPARPRTASPAAPRPPRVARRGADARLGAGARGRHGPRLPGQRPQPRGHAGGRRAPPADAPPPPPAPRRPPTPP